MFDVSKRIPCHLNFMASFYDTHAHLDYPDYAKDMTEVITRAQAAGITRIISIGTDLESSMHAIKLAERFECVFAAVGWHPSNAHEAPDDIREPLRKLVKHPKVVAIGEIGLDYHRRPGGSVSEPARKGDSAKRAGSETGAPDTAADDARNKQKQAEIFQQQLEVASETGLNCVIHQRDSFDDTFAQLKPFAGKVRGVFHCFGESADRMRRVLDIGSLVSFTGIVTFKNGQNVRDIVAATPLDKFMLETDCPYLAPVPYRGKRCEPAYVMEISKTIAQVKSCSLEELSAATCKTAAEFFPKLK
jgi:TatD DNase family protein